MISLKATIIQILTEGVMTESAPLGPYQRKYHEYWAKYASNETQMIKHKNILSGKDPSDISEKDAKEKVADYSHPVDMMHKGKKFYKTGKYGTHRKTGERAAEYSHHDSKTGMEHRAWRTTSGKVEDD